MPTKFRLRVPVKDFPPKTLTQHKLPDAITKGLTLAIACGANIGGMGTLTGQPPNLICSSLMKENFPCYQPEISFAVFLIYAWPISVMFFVLAYVYMSIYWFGLPFYGEDKFKKYSGEKIQSVIRQEYLQLPNMQFCEYYVIGTLSTGWLREVSRYRLWVIGSSDIGSKSERQIYVLLTFPQIYV